MKLPMINFDKFIKSENKTHKHSKLLPNQIRCIICGPAGSGKTNTLLNLIFAENGLKFTNIYIFSKSLYQPKYKLLANIIETIPEIELNLFDDNEQVIHPSEAKAYSIMIFDDVACEKQMNIRNYFAMGRHNHIDTFYLGQTYSTIPKQLIRDNANLIVVFKQDDRNLRHIFHDHVNTDFTNYDKFKQMCAGIWKDDRGFLVINKECNIKKGRYRSGFDKFLNVETT